MSLATLFRSTFSNIDLAKFGPTHWNQLRDLVTRLLDTPSDVDGYVLTRDSTSINGASWKVPTGGGGAPPFGTGYTRVTAGAWDTPAALTEANITNLVSDLAGKASSVHTHVQADVTGLVTALAAKEATANKNTASGYAGLDGSSKLTGSQQVYGTAVNTAAAGNDARLTDARTPTTHATSHQSGGSDPIALDTLAAATNITTLNVSITAHGLAPILPNDATKYLNGVGAYTVPAGGGGSGDLLSVLTAAEIAVTTTVTATISRMHVISGTSANYTITLPAVSGNTGKLIGFRVATTGTKLYTLDGNASETIDGALTRILWAGESAILLCDGSTWSKVGGKSIPMIFKGSRSLTSQTGIAASTGTAIVLDTNTSDTNAPAAMWDSTNGRAVCLRPGRFLVAVFMYASGVSTVAYLNYGINGAGAASIGYQQSSAIGGVAAGAYVDISTFAVGDYIQPRFYGDSGGTITVLGTAAPASLELIELPQW